jgi:hypothetical protein
MVASRLPGIQGRPQRAIKIVQVSYGGCGIDALLAHDK